MALLQVVVLLASLAAFSQGAPVGECPVSDPHVYQFPDDSNCNIYHVCNYADWVQMSCPAGTVFSPQTRNCVGPTYYSCPVTASCTVACGPNGLCDPANNRCQCDPGYEGASCEQDIDECTTKKANCKAICTNTIGSFICSCPRGFVLAPDGMSCIANPCGPVSCQNGGVCTINDNQSSCTCPAGYSGPQCEIADPCAVTNCQNGGNCSIVNDTSSCECPAGFTGSRCETANPCAVVNCQNGGKCSIVNDTSSCECPAGFTGPQCETATSRTGCQSSGIVCQNGGQCVDSSGTALCTCQPGYSGVYCEKKDNLCSMVTCMNGGTCHESASGAMTCSCPDRFGGNFCELVINCDDVQCLNDGTCGIVNNTAGCSCLPGTSGSNCQNRQDCAADGSPCLNGGECSTTSQGFLCACTFGWTGAICQTKRTCSGSFIECQNGGTCEDTADGATCNCASGFTGYNCETVNDECGGCENGGVCRGVPLPGISTNQTLCACPSGFTGDKCETASVCTIPCSPDIGKDTDYFYMFPDVTSSKHVYYCEEGLLQRVELCPNTRYNMYKMECLTALQYANAMNAQNDLFYPA